MPLGIVRSNPPQIGGAAKLDVVREGFKDSPAREPCKLEDRVTDIMQFEEQKEKNDEK
jgi:hypothetical protein